MTHEEPVTRAHPFDQEAWEERYRSSQHVWSGRPNGQLVAEVADLPPGTALDAGCGEGGDALWLTGRGWRVTAVDFSTVALERAAEHAADLGLSVEWLPADLRSWLPPASYDLVSTQFLHIPPEPRRAVFRRLAAAVAPGGTLLVVGHDASDMAAGVRRPRTPEFFFSAAEVASDLDPAEWEVVTTDIRQRGGLDHEGGHSTVVADAVLVARRRS
jgi:SAM-dependent methyltransferase